MFGGPDIKPPPPPPPPPNPPTYASASANPRQQGAPLYSGLGSSILTSPLGTTDSAQIQRKSLLGQ